MRHFLGSVSIQKLHVELTLPVRHHHFTWHLLSQILRSLSHLKFHVKLKGVFCGCQWDWLSCMGYFWRPMHIMKNLESCQKDPMQGQKDGYQLNFPVKNCAFSIHVVWLSWNIHNEYPYINIAIYSDVTIQSCKRINVYF